MHTQPAIAIQSLYKNYGTVHALRGGGEAGWQLPVWLKRK